MGWWKLTEIPEDDPRFWNIIKTLVFECPASIRSTVKCKENSSKRITTYKTVSKRKNSFHERGISGAILNILLSRLKACVGKNRFYKLDSTDSIEEKIVDITKNLNLKDNNFELIIFKKHSGMPQTEAIFYYIRNAFAHGSFEVKKVGDSYIYLLESSKGDEVKARFRLKEESLLEFCKLSKMEVAELKKFQKKIRKKLKQRTVQS